MLAAIRSGLLIHVQNDASGVDLATPMRIAGSLKDACSTHGFKNVEKLSGELANHVQTLIDADIPPTAEQIRRLLDHLIFIEAALAEIGDRTTDTKFDITAFVEESFGMLQARQVPKSVETEPESAFEADAEMLEVFQMEAEDLLRNIQTNLGVLAQHPEDANALWEIRRYAHTFKGAAGIIGLKRISQLAHRVEDLLDTMVENNAGPNERIFGVLKTAFDCLKALSNGEDSPALEGRITDVYGNFDGLLETLAPSEQVALDAPAPINETKNKVDATPTQKRPVVRVALTRLDSLVGIVRDLVDTRSALEQQLTEFERQIDELHNSNRRLQSTQAKFESDLSGLGVDAGTPLSTSLAHGQNRFRDEPIRSQRSYFSAGQFTHDLGETARDTLVIENTLDTIRSGLESLFDNQRRLAEEIQNRLMQLRMIEFGTLTNRLLRTVRVTCDEENKKAGLSIENGQLEIDTQILDWLVEPLMHLLKNSVAHGIESPDTRRLLGKPETGTIVLKIWNDDTHIHLSIADDGRGIGTSALKEKAISNGLITEAEASAMTGDELDELIFLPGLTTAERLSLSAGRGVGMSIVRESVESRKGAISVSSIPQRGTTFTISVPLPAASTRVILVKANSQTLAIPIGPIRHVGEIGLEHVKRDGPRATVGLGAGRFQFHFLGDLLGLGVQQEIGNAPVLMVESESRSCLIAVDKVINTEDVVIEPADDALDAVNEQSGTVVLRSGDRVRVIDLPQLLKTTAFKPDTTLQEEFIVMIVDDSPSVRHMTSKLIESKGWIAETAKDGVDAIEKLRTCRTLPAVILSDIEMPRMDGYEFAAAVRKNPAWNGVRVIFISSRTGEKHRSKAFASGASEVLLKPYDQNDLITLIETLTKLQTA